MLPKFRSLEHINRFLEDASIMIPSFFTNEKEDYDLFSRDKRCITMTHVRWSWRNVALYLESLNAALRTTFTSSFQ